MAVDITISHPNLNGPHEARSFTGSAEDLAEFGISHVQDVGGGTETRRYLLGAMRVRRGDVFVRPVRMVSGESVEETGGAWTWFGSSGALQGAVRWRPVAVVVTEAGQPMRTPTGHPIFVDGTRPNQPATGQPARDPWTGELTGGTQP